MTLQEPTIVRLSMTELLDSVDFRTRSPMYFGSWRIHDLFLFLSGVNYAILNHGIEEQNPLEGFHDWLEHSKGYHQSGGKSWATLIAENVDPSAGNPLEMFFQLFDEFKKSK